MPEFLLDQPKFVQDSWGYFDQAYRTVLSWLSSPAAWSQFAILIVAFVAAWFLQKALAPKIRRLLTPEETSTSILSRARRLFASLLPLALPLFAYLLTAIGQQVAEATFGSSAITEIGKNLFLLIATVILVRRVIAEPFLKLLGRYILIPVAILNLLGLLDPGIEYLDSLQISLGNISFTVLALVRGLIAGALLFWLGRWSNLQSAGYIRKQAEMRPATRELAIKAAELLIFGAAFLLLLNIMGISLSALAIFGGAIGVGLGFGLQKIASNFISGIILLLEGQATVGDYVELDGGEAGTIIKMNARATILETFDGRWIVVPNEDFIITRVTNYSDAGSANRLEAPFSVSYKTDINLVPAIVETAVAAHPGVLKEPYPPDCELRAFGESGIEFAVEFWVNGLDDGPNKYTSDILFLIWNALKDNGIEIPYPHRVIEIQDQMRTGEPKVMTNREG